MKLSGISVAISLALVFLCVKNGSAQERPLYTDGLGVKNDDIQQSTKASNSTSGQITPFQPDIKDNGKSNNYTVVVAKPVTNTTVVPGGNITIYVTTETPGNVTIAPPNITSIATTPSSNSTATNATTTFTTPVKPEPTQPTTQKSVTSPTPVIETTTQVIPKDRRFDGPSFIGGIVLSLGTMAIAFVAFKFYKARTERNYRTL